MKFYYTIIITLFSTSIFAQYSYKPYRVKPDSLMCLQDVSVYREFERQNLHAEAVEAWLKAYKSCGGSKKIVYQDGVKYLKKAIKAETKYENRKLLIDSMMHLYNERIKYFGKAEYVKGRQGIDLINSDRSRAKQAYNLLEQSLTALQEKSDPAVIAHYMLANQILYKKAQISSASVMANYLKSVEILEHQIQKSAHNKKQAKANRQILKIVDKIFAQTKVGSCENIKQFIENKENRDLDNIIYLQKIQHLLRVSKCNNSNYYLKISLKLQALKPSVENAKTIATIYYKQGNYTQAIKYLKNAISLTNNPTIKSRYFNKIAEIRCFKLSDFQTAKNDVLQSLKLQPENAAAYMLWGDIYALASAKFSDDKFSNSAVLWLAIDKYNKAKLLDKNIAAKANQKISYYKKYLPSKEDVFMQGYKNGDKYKIGGWINEETAIKY